MQRFCTLLLLAFVLLSAGALAQGRRVAAFPYNQDFSWVMTSTTSFPTTRTTGGEFTADANTSGTWLAGSNIAGHGLNPNGGAGSAIRLQTTAAAGAAGFVWYGDLTCYTADSLTIDWTKVQNGTDDPVNELRIATNGGSGGIFTDLPLANIEGGAWPTFDNSATAQSGKLRVKLPASLAASADVRIRIYAVSISGTGNQPRVVVDNLMVTAAGITPQTAMIDSLVPMRTSSLMLYPRTGAQADSVLVIRRAGSAPTAVPVNSTSYTAGQGLNSTDTVIYFGPASSAGIAVSGLQTNANYYVSVYGYRSCNRTYSAAAASANATTLSCGGEPAMLGNVTTTGRSQTTLSFGYTPGFRTDSILVVRRRNGTPTATLSNGTRYFVGQGLNLTDTVVYFGPATSPYVAMGLIADTNYSFALYGFQSCNTTYSATRALATARTYCLGSVGNVADVSVRYTTATNIGLSISAVENANNYIVFSIGPDTVMPRPMNGVQYSVGSVIGDDTVRFIGNNRQPILTGLGSARTYRLMAYGFRECNFYYSDFPDSVSAVTVAACSTAVPGMVDSVRVTRNVADSLTLSWRTEANTSAYLVVARVDSTPTVPPVNSTFYAAGDTLGGAANGRVFVLARTTDTTVRLRVPQNTAYFIRVFALRACDLSYSPSSAVVAVATRGTAIAQRFVIRAGVLDTIRFAGAEVAFNEPVDADGSLMITRRSGQMDLDGIPMFRSGQTPIDLLSTDRWWSFDWRNRDENVNFDLTLDITGLPGVQDTSDLEIVFRTAPTFPWEDFITTGYRRDSTGDYLLAENRRFFSSDYAIGANSNRNTLPVKLLSFEGFSREGRNILRWKTAEEMDNAGFRLYRASAGADGVFTLVADHVSDPRLRGAGNTTQQQSYDYVDQSSDLRSGASYIYKLEEVSLDGSHNEIGRLVLTMDAASRPGAAFRMVPNPVVGSAATVSYRLSEDMPVQMTLVNTTGETVRVLADEPGAKAGNYSMTVNVADLPAGTYFCRVVTGGSIAVYPVTIIR